MKKRLLILSMVLLTAVSGTFAEISYYLHEGFESGIPASWTQETSNPVAAWATESLATRPSADSASLAALKGAPEGQQYAFERWTSSTRNARVKLIAPVIDFSGFDVYQPVLSFQYAQMGRNLAGTYCLDTLSIYYRTSAASAWTLVRTLATATTDWTKVTIELPGTTNQSFYQLAFEAKEADGLGVYLDDVKVNNTSQCVPASGITVVANAEGAVINWTGDFSNVQFDVLVYDHAVSPLDSLGTASAGTPVFSQVVTGAYDVTISGGLLPLTTYYVYVRGYCDDNESGYTAWTSGTFRTRAKITNFPYVETFDSLSHYEGAKTSIVAGDLPEGWSRLHSTGLSAKAPGVTTSTNLSVNSSKSLFLGADPSYPTSKTGTLADGQYVIAVLPEVSGTAINQLQISFWVGAYLHTPGMYDPKVEVGVMTNPDDASTFVALETIEVETATQFKKAVVSLASYAGAGHYIAFRAQGAELQNAVSVDDIEVNVAGVAVPGHLALTAIAPSSMTIAADKHSADSWNVLVAEGYYRDSVPAAILSQNGITAATATLAVPDSLQGKVLTVYAQGVKNGVAGAWSFPLTVRVPELMPDTVPLNLIFNSGIETIKAVDLQHELKSTSTTKVPACLYLSLQDVSYVPQISGSSISLNNVGNYFTLGYLPTLNTKEVVFYLRGTASVAGEVALGVMTNPYDESTFEQLAVFEGAKSGSEYNKCVFDLDQYQGQGHYLAFRSQATSNYIQKIDITAIPTCREVSAVTCLAGSSKASLSWDANNMTAWQVVVSESRNLSNPVLDTIVSTSTYLISGLESEKTYYYKVNTVCGNDTVEMYGTKSFTTSLGIPYTQTFASSTWPAAWTRLSGKSEAFFAGTCTSTTSGWGTSSYPNYGLPGNHAGCEIYSTTYNYWMVSPALSTAEFADQSIRLTWDMALTHWNSAAAPAHSDDDRIWLVISEDGGQTWERKNATVWSDDASVNPNYSITTIPVSNGKYALDLTAYAGKTIAVAFGVETPVGGTDNRIHVANVKISSFDANCPGVSTLKMLSVGPDNATISWTIVGNQSADVQVATSSTFADSTLIYNQTVVDVNSVSVTGLEGNTRYYVRVKQTCDPNAEYKTVDFKTECTAITPAAFGVETFSNPNALDCWTVGFNGKDTTYSTEPAITTLNGFGNVLMLSKSGLSYRDGVYAILPALDLGNDTIYKYQVKFDAFTTSKAVTNVNRLDVKVITDPNDGATWVDAKTVQIAAATDSTNMKSYVVSFANVETDYNDDYGKYIGFYFLAGSDSTNVVYIDNVQVELIPSCPQVTEVLMPTVGSEGGVARWSATGAEAYQVAVFGYKSVDSAMVFNQIVTADSIQIAGLQGNTRYFVGVRAICAAGDTAAWSPLTAIKTECAAVTSFPWTEDFETYPTGAFVADCWNNYHSAGTASTVFEVSATALGGNSTHMLKLPDAQIGNQVRLELPFMNIPEANAYEFRMDMYRLSSAKPLEGIIVTAEQGAQVDTLLWIPRSMTASTATVDAVEAVGWYKYAATIPFAGEGKIVLTGYSEYGNYSSADNLEIRMIPTCSTPKRLKTVAAGLDSVQVVWEGISTTGYVIELSAVEDFASLVDSAVVNDTTYTFRGLASGSLYYARVRSNCDGGDWAAATVKTLIGLPFAEDFQESGTIIPNGWSRYNGDIYTEPVSTTSSGWTFTSSAGGGMTAYHTYCSAYYSTYTDYKYALATPEIVLNSKAGNNIVLSFDLALTSSYSGTTAPSATVCNGRHFSVALLTDTALVPLMVWSSDSMATEGKYSEIPALAKNYSVDITEYAGQHVALVFFHSIGTSTSTSYSYINLDNIKLQTVNMNCLAPAIAVLDATTDSLSIAIANPDSSNFMLQISSSRTFATVLDSVVTNDTVVGFGGLNSASYYYVRAKKLCGEGEESGWSDAIAGLTDCAPFAVPFAVDFKEVEVPSTYELPLCWTKVKEYKSSSTATISYPYISTVGYLYMYGGDQIAALPEMAQPLNKLTFAMRYKASVNTTYGTLKIGYYTNLDSAFVQVDELPQTASETDYELVLSDLPASAKYLAIRYNGGTSTSGTGYVYNVSLDLTPSCLALKSIEFANVERRSLDVIWTPKAASPHYDLVLSDHALNDSLLALATPITLDTTYYHADNLTRNTTYYVYVRANCGAEDGVGPWMEATVRTKNIGPDCQKAAPGEIVHGGAGSAFAPIAAFYKNSYTEQIYTATELRAAGLSAGYVSKVAFQYLLSSSYTKTVTVFVGETNDSQVSTISGFYLPAAASDAQTITLNTADKWYEIELSTPYYWNGSSNLVIGVLSMGDSYWSNGVAGFAGGATTNNMVLHRRSDTANPLTGMTTTPTASTDRADIRLSICPAGSACPAVDMADVELLGDGTSSAKITWTASRGDYANTYVFCYADNDTIAPDSIAAKYTDIDSLSIVLTGLTENTRYYGYIKTVCDGEGHDDGTSNWYSVSFLTNANCPAVIDLDVEVTGKNSAVATWNTVFAEQEKTFAYVLSLDTLSAEDLAAATLVNVDTTVLSWDTLSCGQTYHLYVASRCGLSKSAFAHVSFTQPVSCPAVANLHTEVIAFNAVQLAWEKGQFGEETEWEVGIVGIAASVKTVSDTRALLIGLEGATDYTAYVKALCSATDESVAASIDFKTANAPTGDTQIGTGSTSAYLVYTSYGNTYSQHIYTAEELQAAGAVAGTINAVSFEYTGTSSTYDKIQSVYIATTDKTEFADATYAAMETDLRLSYGPEMRQYAAGWQQYDFFEGFDWDGVSNIVVGVLTNQGGAPQGSSSGWSVRGSTMSNYLTAYRYRDNTAIDVDNLSAVSSGTRAMARPNIKFGFVLDACAKVANLKADTITKDSVVISWFPGGSETTWNTVFSTTPLTEAELATAKRDTTSDFTKHFGGLNEDTDYYFYVRAVCSSSEHGDWKELHIVTDADCRAPKAIHADTIAGTFAQLSWTNSAAGVPEGYVVAYGLADEFDLAVDSTYSTIRVNDTTVVLSNLKGLTNYKVAVAAACDAQHTSRWSEIFEFQTECSTFEVPWSENFDGTPNLSCWTIPAGTSLYNTATYVRTGNALKYATTAATVTILPDFGDLNGLQLNFWYRMEGSGSTTSMGTFQAGYITNPNDDDTFVALVDCPKVYQYTEVEVPYASGIPAGARPAIKYHNATSATWYAFIDDVKMDSIPQCFKPTLDFVGATSHSVTVALEDSASYIVEIANVATFAQLTDSVAVQDSVVTFDGLIAGKAYYVRAKRLCDANTASDWSMPLTVKTAYGLPFAEEFVSGLPADWKKATGLASSVFAGTSLTTTTSGWTSQTASLAPQGMEQNMKLNIYGTSCNYWMISPTLDLSDTTVSNVRLTFDAAWTTFGGQSAPTSSTPDDKFMVVISTDGGATWSKSNAFIWANDPTEATMGAVDDIDASAEHIAIDLSRFVGGSLTVGFYGESTVTGGDNDFHVANIEIAAYNPNCAGIASIAASNVGTKTADIDFTYAAGNHDAYIEVAASENFASLVASDTIRNDSTYHVTGLEHSTIYYVRIKQVCGEGEESAYLVSSFKTAVGLPVTPDFSDGIPADWTKYSYHVETSQFATSDFAVVSGGWSKVAADTVIDAAHIRGNIYGTSWQYWLVTPGIDLSDNVGDGVMLSVDLGLTPYSATSASKRNTGLDDRFMIVISEDGGLTWNLANATIWDNDSTTAFTDKHQSYNGIPEHGTTYRVNMTPYTGKVVAVGFYGESTETNADNYFHFGNIKIVEVPATNLKDSVCAGDAYNKNGFSVSGQDLMTAGIYTFDHFTPAVDTLHQDSITILTLTVNEGSSTEFQTVICEGEEYNENGFHFIADPKTTPAVMRNVVKGTNGCDSVAVLHITVNPTLYAEEADSIVKGETYTWHGKVYDQSGTYYDTLQSVTSGCDSVVTLVLTYVTALDELSALPLYIMPNPVVAGETFAIRGYISGYEANLTIHSLNGTCVLNQTVYATDEKILVQAPGASGVYIVQIKTSDDHLYRAKLIVE